MSTSIKTWDFGPEDGQGWTLERVQAYHIQCIAAALTRIVTEMGRQNEWAKRLINENAALRGALELIEERATVEQWFGDSGHMRYRDFMDRWRETFGWTQFMHNPMEAIKLSKYLDITPTGSGHRVYLRRDGGDQS